MAPTQIGHLLGLSVLQGIGVLSSRLVTVVIERRVIYPSIFISILLGEGEESQIQ